MSIAPLLSPVVPPVYCSSARSVSGSTRHLARRARALSSGRKRLTGAPFGTVAVISARALLAFATGRRRPSFAARRQVVGDGGDDDLAQRGVAAHRGDGGVRPVQADADRRAAVLQLVAQLGLGVQRVVLHDDGAEAQRGVGGDDVLRAVRQHDRDAVALADAEVPERGGEPVDRVLELAVRHRRAEEGERRLRRERGRGVVEQPGQRDDREVVVGRDALGVARQPGPLGVRRASWRASRRAVASAGAAGTGGGRAGGRAGTRGSHATHARVRTGRRLDRHVAERQQRLDRREDDEEQQQDDGGEQQQGAQQLAGQTAGQGAPDPAVHLRPRRRARPAAPSARGVASSSTACTTRRWRAEYSGWQVVSVSSSSVGSRAGPAGHGKVTSTARGETMVVERTDVDVPALARLEHDAVALDELAEAVERRAVGGAVAGDDDVAELAGQRGAGDVAGALLEVRDGGALDDDPGVVAVQRRDVQDGDAARRSRAAAARRRSAARRARPSCGAGRRRAGPARAR